MGRNSFYWTGKSQRAKEAAEHEEQMRKYYSDNISRVALETKIYTEDSVFNDVVSENNKYEIIVESIDSVSAIMEYSAPSPTAVLNFASYKYPGGGFLQGSRAQEECLCHKSTLFNVLSKFEDNYYVENRKDLNGGLYRNKALYSPNVYFRGYNVIRFCDVITCAAPNYSVAQRYGCATKEENSEALKSRIEFVLNIAKENEVENLILGAFGCGVFGQDAAEVAQVFKDNLENKFKNVFHKVIFAIPQGKDGNYEKFKEVWRQNMKNKNQKYNKK